MEIKVSKQAIENLEKDLEPEEVQDFLDMLKSMAEDGSLIENSEPVDLDKMQLEEPDVYEELWEALAEIDEKLN